MKWPGVSTRWPSSRSRETSPPPLFLLMRVPLANF
jgi:hypothetical protein